MLLGLTMTDFMNYMCRVATPLDVVNEVIDLNKR